MPHTNKFARAMAYTRTRRNVRRRKRKTYRKAYRKVSNRKGPFNRRTGGFLGIERKFVDFTVGTHVVSSLIDGNARADPEAANPSGIRTISGVAQGIGESQRDGRKCNLISLLMTGSLSVDSVHGTAGSNKDPTVVRLAIVWDTQTNADTIDPAQVWNKPPTNHQLGPYAYRNLQYTKRFKVLYDQKFIFNPDWTSGWDGSTEHYTSQPLRKSFVIMKKLNIPVNFVGTENKVASIADNSLHVVCWKHGVVAASNGHPVFLNYTTRIRFVG